MDDLKFKHSLNPKHTQQTHFVNHYHVSNHNHYISRAIVLLHFHLDLMLGFYDRNFVNFFKNNKMCNNNNMYGLFSLL